MSTVTAATLAKGLRLLAAIVDDEGRSSLTSIAAAIGLPLPTAHRLALTLETEGFLQRGQKGYFFRGPAIDKLGGRQNPAHALAARLRRQLAQLAISQAVHVHFGMLEDGMVTYLVKENGTDAPLFTEEHMQLEAYCSAIGKILLAALPIEELDAYLENGPFIALTHATIIDADALRQEIAEVRISGVAHDKHEIRDDLYCIAVPVCCPRGHTIAAISASILGSEPTPSRLGQLRRALRKIAISVPAPASTETASAETPLT